MRRAALLSLLFLVAAGTPVWAQQQVYVTNTPAVTVGNTVNVAIASGGSATATVGGTANVALVSAVGADPCQSNAKVYQLINQATGTQLFAGTSSKKTYVCSLSVMSATAQNVALVSGTGTVCATGTAGMTGGPSAATGWNFAANGQANLGTGGFAVAVSGANADNVCLLQSSTGQVSGVLSYVVQ